MSFGPPRNEGKGYVAILAAASIVVTTAVTVLYDNPAFENVLRPFKSMFAGSHLDVPEKPIEQRAPISESQKSGYELMQLALDCFQGETSYETYPFDESPIKRGYGANNISEKPEDAPEWLWSYMQGRAIRAGEKVMDVDLSYDRSSIEPNEYAGKAINDLADKFRKYADDPNIVFYVYGSSDGTYKENTPAYVQYKTSLQRVNVILEAFNVAGIHPERVCRGVAGVSHKLAGQNRPDMRSVDIMGFNIDLKNLQKTYVENAFKPQ